MKRLSILTTLFILTCSTLIGQESILLSGTVVDNESRQRLPAATVWINGTDMATVTNNKGEFSLRVPRNVKSDSISISFVGYKVYGLKISSLGEKHSDITIRLEPSPISLRQVTVHAGDAKSLVRLAFRLIPDNYPNSPSNIVTFYREIIKKGSNYLALAEAVLFGYKSSYLGFGTDYATIYKGRRNIDYNRLDTLLFKLQGGITTAFKLDVVRNPENLMFGKDLELYNFEYTTPDMLYDRFQYVVNFNQNQAAGDNILFRGRIYIDSESMAISRMEFFMNIEDNKAAENIFIRRKPPGVKATPTRAYYVVEYKPTNNVWHFSYVKSEVQFRCRWPKRLFSSTYSTISEMVVTDRITDRIEKIEPSSRVRSADIIVEKLTDFTDQEFWQDYNIIEPDQSIDAIVKRIEKQLKRRRD